MTTAITTLADLPQETRPKITTNGPAKVVLANGLILIPIGLILISMEVIAFVFPDASCPVNFAIGLWAGGLLIVVPGIIAVRAGCLVSKKKERFYSEYSFNPYENLRRHRWFVTVVTFSFICIILLTGSIYLVYLEHRVQAYSDKQNTSKPPLVNNNYNWRRMFRLSKSSVVAVGLMLAEIMLIIQTCFACQELCICGPKASATRPHPTRTPYPDDCDSNGYTRVELETLQNPPTAPPPPPEMFLDFTSDTYKQDSSLPRYNELMPPPPPPYDTNS